MGHQKKTKLRAGLVLSAVVAVAAGLIALSQMDVAAPSQPVEKTLDAKAFLENK